MNILVEKLDGLVKSGAISYYELECKEEEPGSGMREYQTLTVYFRNGEILSISTLCSGCMENTEFCLEA